MSSTTNVPEIRVGIGGWTYEPWRGTFYPDKLPQKRELEYAASKLTAIEINATYYGRQKGWENWAKTVPDDFQFQQPELVAVLAEQLAPHLGPPAVASAQDAEPGAAADGGGI